MVLAVTSAPLPSQPKFPQIRSLEWTWMASCIYALHPPDKDHNHDGVHRRLQDTKGRLYFPRELSCAGESASQFRAFDHPFLSRTFWLLSTEAYEKAERTLESINVVSTLSYLKTLELPTVPLDSDHRITIPAVFKESAGTEWLLRGHGYFIEVQPKSVHERYGAFVEKSLMTLASPESTHSQAKYCVSTLFRSFLRELGPRKRASDNEALFAESKISIHNGARIFLRDSAAVAQLHATNSSEIVFIQDPANPSRIWLIPSENFRIFETKIFQWERKCNAYGTLFEDLSMHNLGRSSETTHRFFVVPSGILRERLATRSCRIIGCGGYSILTPLESDQRN